MSRTNSTYQASPQNFFPFSYEETIGESAPDDFLYVKDNHLGNVLVVVSDRKLPVDINADNIVDYYTADVVSATDYYAFGSLMPGRSFNSTTHRYGFNGQEKDDEIKGSGNSLDFGARIYDSRIGRWLAVDPGVNKQAGWSPYKAFNDCPIVYADPDGEREYLRIVLIDADGKTTVLRKLVSYKVKTDGIRHTTWKGQSRYSENYYYDFEKVVTVTQNKDGSITTSERINFLRNKGVKESDFIWFGGAKRGETQTDVSDYIDSKLNTGAGIVFTTSNADGPGGGEESRKGSNLADGETENIDVLQDAIGGPGALGGGKYSAYLRRFTEAIDAVGDTKDIVEEASKLLGQISPNPSWGIEKQAGSATEPDKTKVVKGKDPVQCSYCVGGKHSGGSGDKGGADETNKQK